MSSAVNAYNRYVSQHSADFDWKNIEIEWDQASRVMSLSINGKQGERHRYVYRVGADDDIDPLQIVRLGM